MANGNKKKKYKDHKLTPVVESKLKDFKLPLRYPGWKVDKAEAVNDAGVPTEDITAVFVEETLGGLELEIESEKKKVAIRHPFQPPFRDLGDPRWILGYTLDENAKGDFNVWLRDLSIACRRYNGGLYRLRQLHLKAEDNLIEMERLHVDAQDHDQKPDDAETWFKEDVANLETVLNRFNKEENGKKEEGIVDFIQVNGYIVSIRAVAMIFDGSMHDKGTARMLAPQPVGSSSSHWSLSSAFSSYRPPEPTGGG